MKAFTFPPSTTEYMDALNLLKDIWGSMIENDMEETYIFRELTEFLGMED